MIFGNYYGANFTDDTLYFYQSQRLADYWKNGDFNLWLCGGLKYTDKYINGVLGYGNYNFFVIILAILRIIGLNSLKELLIIKLTFTIISCYLLFDICNYYSCGLRKYYIIILFFLFPTNIAINSILIRDSIILMLILYLFNEFIKKNSIISTKTLLSLILLMLFRAYLAFIVIVLYFIKKYVFKSEKITKKDSLILFISIFTFLIVCNFYKLGIHNKYIDFVVNKINTNFGIGILGQTKLIIISIIRIFIPVVKVDMLNNISLLTRMFWISNIIYLIISIIFIFKAIFIFISEREGKRIDLIRNAIFFSFFNTLIMMAKDGFLESRITLIWLWSFFIIIFSKKGEKNGKCDNTNF